MFRIVDNSAKWILGCGLMVTVFTPIETTHASTTETVLYSFKGGPNDGANPYASLIEDKKGNLYGTTIYGGTNGQGVVFKVTPHGSETVLSQEASYGGLISDKKGNLYSTTYGGGSKNSGSVFELSKKGVRTILYSFCSVQNCTDGEQPYAGLVADKKGNLYGTTYAGGAAGVGTVFKLARNGTETVLFSFGGTDGQYPYAGLIADKAGNLYGTTSSGGEYYSGVVFKVAANGSETVLHTFNGTDGQFPYAELIADKAGNLYGTTTSGGNHGYGNVFKVTPGGTETSLYSFCSNNGCTDGDTPYGALIADEKGNLYGTTVEGGSDNFGTVFELTPSGTETVLYSFTGGNDGANPEAGLIADKSGNLYGATYLGGTDDYGTIFTLKE